jgi:hypothetical protein
MSTFPGSPRVMEGAILGLDPFKPVTKHHRLSIQSRFTEAQLAGRMIGGRVR